MELSIILVNYKVYPYLAKCIASILKAIDPTETEIIVVDNESDPIAIQQIIQEYPHIITICNTTNIGYSKANNQGLFISKGEYILFLNPDTIVSTPTILYALQYLSLHKKVGAVGVRMLNEEGVFLPESKRAYPNPITALFKIMGLDKLFPRSAYFNRYALGNLNALQIHKIEVIAGAFFMSRKKILIELGGFDEQFFMYAEDIDLSIRILHLGYENHYLGNHSILHYKGASTNKNSIAYHNYFYHSMKLFVQKYYSKNTQWVIRTILLMSINMVKIMALLKNQRYRF